MVPPDWATREWLERTLSVHGVRAVARAVGRSRARVRRLVQKFGVRVARAPGVHPCRTEGWLREHYVRRQGTLAECARAAGTSRQTIARWLTGCGYHVRTAAEAQSRSWTPSWDLALKIDTG